MTSNNCDQYKFKWTPELININNSLNFPRPNPEILLKEMLWTIVHNEKNVKKENISDNIK
jgi:hypothetical protein